MYFPDTGCVLILRTLYVYATVVRFLSTVFSYVVSFGTMINADTVLLFTADSCSLFVFELLFLYVFVANEIKKTMSHTNILKLP